jgi:hypothetical protein
MRCLKACSSLERHLHTIAYEYLEKQLSARDEKGLENWDRGSQSDIVWSGRTLSDPVIHCTVILDFVQVRVSCKNLRFLNFFGIKPNFVDMD